MKSRFVISAAVACAFALAAIANADEPARLPQRMHASLTARFQKADADGNGQLTRQEVQAGMPRIYQHFAEIDTANKGYITLDQIEAFVAARAAARQNKQSTSDADAL